VTLAEPPPLGGTFESIPDTCARGVGRLAFLPTGGVPGYQAGWSANAGDGNGFQRFGLQTGNYSVQVTDLNGCQQTFSEAVDEIPAVTGEIALTPTTPCTQEEVAFSFVGDRTIATYAWDFGNGDYSADPAPRYNYFLPGIYQVALSVEDVYACPLEVSVAAFVSSAMNVFVPNAFTPDNDGVNDAFAVVGVGMEKFHLRIWDRWGVLVFESFDPLEPWIGDIRGGTHYAQSDVYSYRVEVSGPCAVDEVFTGTVTLVR
jgi:gliding motility-associated-like protein